MMDEDRSVSSTRCITKSLRDEFFVLRVASVRPMRDGTLPELWRQARIRSSSSPERSWSFRWVCGVEPPRAGL